MKKASEALRRFNHREAGAFPTAEDFEEYYITKGIPNTLEYEAAYKKLLDQVKDKSTREKYEFLLPHTQELRDMLDTLTACDDYDNTIDDSLLSNDFFRDDVLALIMIYRYEHNISIMDDLENEKSLLPAIDTLRMIDKEKRREEKERREELKRTDPVAYATLVKKEKEEFEAKWERIFKEDKEDGPAFDHPVTIDELMKLI